MSYWVSGASSSKKSSIVSSTTSAIRASGRSTLLTIGTTGSPASNALRSTKRGLGPGTIGGVDEQHRAVDHREGAFDLAAEVGVARRVDDVQAAGAEPEGGLLGENRDALLALEIEGVEDPVDDGGVGPEGAGLAEHRVDESRLAVVDVGDDRHVAQLVLRPHRHHRVLSAAIASSRALRLLARVPVSPAPGPRPRLLMCRPG